MPTTKEYKDIRGKNRIRHKAGNGKITYSSNQGYENKGDMRATAINTAIELLNHYSKDITPDQYSELTKIVME